MMFSYIWHLKNEVVQEFFIWLFYWCDSYLQKGPKLKVKIGLMQHLLLNNRIVYNKLMVQIITLGTW